LEIIQILVTGGEGQTQCHNVTSTEPDETGKVVLITFTNGTDEPLYICRENEPLEHCGIFYSGDSTSKQALYPTGKYIFIGQNSGSVVTTYVATDAPNQTKTITK
jgi:hypothetical protein